MSLRVLIGQNIKRMRKTRGLSQEEFSQRTGITQARLSQIENGKLDISVKTLEQMAKALDILPFELLKAQPGKNNLLTDKISQIENLPADLKKLVIQVIDLAHFNSVHDSRKKE